MKKLEKFDQKAKTIQQIKQEIELGGLLDKLTNQLVEKYT